MKTIENLIADSDLHDFISGMNADLTLYLPIRRSLEIHVFPRLNDWDTTRKIQWDIYYGKSRAFCNFVIDEFCIPPTLVDDIKQSIRDFFNEISQEKQ